MGKEILVSAIGSGITTLAFYLLGKWDDIGVGRTMEYIEPASIFAITFITLFCIGIAARMIFRWLRHRRPSNRFRDLHADLEAARAVVQTDDPKEARAVMRLLLRIERVLDELGIPYTAITPYMDLEDWQQHLAKLAPLARRGDVEEARRMEVQR